MAKRLKQLYRMTSAQFEERFLSVTSSLATDEWVGHGRKLDKYPLNEIERDVQVTEAERAGALAGRAAFATAIGGC